MHVSTAIGAEYLIRDYTSSDALCVRHTRHSLRIEVTKIAITLQCILVCALQVSNLVFCCYQEHIASANVYTCVVPITATPARRGS